MKFRSGRFTGDDWENINDAAGKLSPLPIWIDDSPRSSHIDIQKKSRALKAKEGLDILWIDYLGFLDGDKSQRSKVYEVESITRSLKALAKELKIPIVLICQLNRQCEQRDNKRPMLSDLRDSGALEQDADLVLFLYNDAKYHKDTQDAGIIECEIAKQRNGPTARIKLKWDEDTTRFDNLMV
jgi:replicative DNA helicase